MTTFISIHSRIMASHHGSFDHGSDHVVMPYSMEYALPSQHYHTTADLTPNELYPVQLPGGQEGIPQNIGQESLNTDSSNNLISSLTNANAKSSQQQVGNSAKVKRSDDLWTGN